MNLRTQIEDFERVASGMRELPKAIEGTVAQALRRAMAARAKLDRDAETAMDETLGAVDEQLDALNEAIAKVAETDDQIRKVALGQREIGSRLDSLQEAFLARLDAVETENRSAQEQLARAIDRSAAGRDPRASESLGKAPRRAVTPKAQPVRRKASPQQRPSRRRPSKPTDDSSD
jgi:hypothetical protein